MWICCRIWGGFGRDYKIWPSGHHGLLDYKVEGKDWWYMQIGFGSNKKTRHMMPSGHKAFLVNNTRDVDLLLMHNKTFAAE
jgi:ribosomal protein L32E